MFIYCFFVISHIVLAIFNWIKINPIAYTLIIMIPYSLVAFAFDPVQQARHGGGGVDLYRHFERIDLIRLGLGDDLYLEAPLSEGYMWLMAHLFSNNHFLPMISTWIFYGIAFIAILLTCQYLKAGSDEKRLAIWFFIAFYQYFMLVSNIRYPIAVALFVLIFYFDVIKNDRCAKFIYIIPLLLHPGVGLLLIIRILVAVRLKYSVFILSLLILLLLGNFEGIVQQLLGVLYFWPDLQVLALGILFKLFTYNTENVYDLPLIYRILSLYAMAIYILILFIAYNYKCILLKNVKIYRMVVFALICSFLGEITNYMNGNFTERVLAIMPFLMAFIVADIFNNLNSKSAALRKFMKMLVMVTSSIYLFIHLFKVYITWIYLGL